MIRLYHGSGALDFQLVGGPRSQDWELLSKNVTRLLRAQGANDAARWLESLPFELYEGTNYFGDEFSLLQSSAPLHRYVELAESKKQPDTEYAFRRIAETVSEIGPYIRFIVVELDTKTELKAVPEPPLQITSEVVERALADCQQLMHSQGATSGVDRVHTAFHGYLRAVCRDAAIDVPEKSGITDLFKVLRRQHPRFERGTAPKEIDKVARSMAAIVDSLNPLRNSATLAHSNDQLLEEADAMLVINSVRTLLHYIDAKIG